MTHVTYAMLIPLRS